MERGSQNRAGGRHGACRGSRQGGGLVPGLHSRGLQAVQLSGQREQAGWQAGRQAQTGIIVITALPFPLSLAHSVHCLTLVAWNAPLASASGVITIGTSARVRTAL